MISTRIRDIKGWIPESDIDGVDSNDNVLSDIINADFNNGFISCAIKPSSTNLPIAILDDVSNGFEILSAKYFKHSSRGDCFFYILYRLTSGYHVYKFYISDGYETKEIKMFDDKAIITYSGKPNNINYNLINDQFKVNLNINIDFVFGTPTGNVTKSVIGNLSLEYLKEKTWGEGKTVIKEEAPGVFSTTKYEEIKRLAGWYLTPRWLGWSFPNVLPESGSSIIEDFEDESYEYGIAMVGGVRSDQYRYQGVYSVRLANLTPDLKYAGIFSATITDPKSMLFWADFTTMPNLTSYGDKIALRAKVVCGTVITYHYPQYVDLDFSTGIWKKYKIDIGVTGACTITLESYSDYWTFSDGYVHDLIYIDNVEFPGTNDLTLIGYNQDKQRYSIKHGNDFDENKFSLPIVMLDWRIEKFELYSKKPTAGLSFLADAKDVMLSLEGSGLLTTSFDSTLDENETSTINFNYGLGGEIRVDNQSMIFNEVVYKGRVYFVKNDYRVYQSHIAGNGLIQPDSFPLDIDKQFGYFITDNSEVNRGLFVTPLEELGILTNVNNYIYYIQSGSGISYRIRKAINGGRGVLSVNSIIKELNGSPSAGVVAWNDNTGIYIYGGGRNEPNEISKRVLENYWIKLPTGIKLESKGFYYKPKNEFWWVLGDFILIFELDYGTFRKYVYGFAVKEFVGMLGDNLYILSNDNKVYLIDIDADERLSCKLETHYSTGYAISGNQYIPAKEDDDKILQELSISFEPNYSSIAKVQIIADGNYIDSPILYSSNYKVQKSLSPYLVRYGKIKFSIEIDGTDSCFREFTYSYTNMQDGMGKGSTFKGVYGVGMDSGNNIGQTA